MSKLSVFVEQFDGQQVRITPDGRVSVWDAIAAFASIKNPRDAWSSLIERHPEVVAEIETYQFPGRGQRKTPVAGSGSLDKILRILGVHPHLEIATADKFYPRTEIQIIKVLISAFHDCQPCPQFYCDGYRIDLYLAKNRIAIECDENNHTAYNTKLEQQREKTIKSSLGCSFIRFDPYAKEFNLGDVIAKIRALI